MGERFGSAVSRLRERKGKGDNQKKSHGCRKTSRAWKIFFSADLELDGERSGRTFHPKCLASHSMEGASVAEIQEHLDSVKSQLCKQ